MNETAIVPYEQLKDLVATPEVKERFQEVMGESSAAFLASVINTVYLDGNLSDADPNSIIASAMQAAILDLPIDPNLGFAWIIPYKKNKAKIAQFQIGYKGYIQLAIRTGYYAAINTTEIYDGELVQEDRLTGKIELSGSKQSDEVIGFIAYFKLVTGFEKWHYMSRPDMIAHAERYSKSYGKDWSAWSTHFDAMGKKTVIKHLISKYGIMTTRMTNVMVQDTKVDTVEEDAGTINGRLMDPTAATAWSCASPATTPTSTSATPSCSTWPARHPPRIAPLRWSKLSWTSGCVSRRSKIPGITTSIQWPARKRSASMLQP